MTATALLSGKIVREPERKISKLGPYASATVRDGYGDDATWWLVFAFSESAVEELLALHDCDAVRGIRVVQGAKRQRRERDHQRRDEQRQGPIGSAESQRPIDELNDPVPF
jgi:hypothetical protein